VVKHFCFAIAVFPDCGAKIRDVFEIAKYSCKKVLVILLALFLFDVLLFDYQWNK